MSTSVAKLPEMPSQVHQHAEKIAFDAKLAYEAEWRAEMQAHENERIARSKGEAARPTWLEDDPCEAWCHGGLDHQAGTHPSDRTHYSETVFIPLVTMEPVVVGHPEHWAQPEVQIGLERRYREREARVTISDGADKFWLRATLNEAEEIAKTLLDLIAQARDKASST